MDNGCSVLEYCDDDAYFFYSYESIHEDSHRRGLMIAHFSLSCGKMLTCHMLYKIHSLSTHQHQSHTGPRRMYRYSNVVFLNTPKTRSWRGTSSLRRLAGMAARI
jgi:hypothetical protein